MTSFIRTASGDELINTDQIERIVENGSRTLAILKGGGAEELTHTIEEIARVFCPLIGAAPNRNKSHGGG